jgi:hypothetical protein
MRRNAQPVLLLGVAVAVMGAALALVVVARTKLDIQTSRHVQFRICQRETTDRAYARLYDRSALARYMLPLLECGPNLVGLPAREMTPTQTRVFLERARRRELTLRERGICIRAAVDAVC